MFKDCYSNFDFEKGRLRIGNDTVEKTVLIDGSCICTEEIIDKRSGKVWRTEALKWQCCPVLAADEVPKVIVDVINVEDHPLMKSHMKVILELSGQNGTVWYEYITFPEVPFVYSQAFVEARGEVIREEITEITVNTSGNENLKIDAAKQSPFCDSDTLDCIPLGSSHLEVESFVLYDKTDINDSLVERQTVPVYKRGMLNREGNIFRISDIANGDSLLLVKHAPTVSSALNRKGKDLTVLGNSHALLKGTGIDFSSLPTEKIPYYASAVGVGKTENILNDYWQYNTSFSKGDADGKMYIMSNTWGDRSQDMAVCEEFMLEEIESAHKIGIDIVQIDDGWQSGVTVNSLRGGNGVWEGYYGADSNFWAVNPERFPHGLEPVIEKAKIYGMKIGLWFSPDSSDEFANFEKDIETLWGLNQRYGVEYFKLDGVKIRSKLSEKRFVHMLEELTQRSGGRIRFNLDVTAEDRFGYLYQPQYGTLFVENRYTDWGNYFPHNTFKNIWNLSAVVPTRRLQMELLNKNRNPEQYEGMLFAPAEYGMDYLFASVMPANPLVWMEVSNLPVADAECLAAVVKRYKPYQHELFESQVIPIGEVPNGTHFSGYCCRNADGSSGHLILFREKTEAEEYVFCTPVSLINAKITEQYQSAPAKITCEGKGVRVKFSSQRAFVWLRYEM